MIVGLLGILVFVVVIAMSTLGSVLLVYFFRPKAARGSRVLAAAAAGPASILLPVSLLTMADGMDEAFVAFLGVGFIGAILFGVIGWPVSHFATRRLDRMTDISLETFE